MLGDSPNNAGLFSSRSSESTVPLGKPSHSHVVRPTVGPASHESHAYVTRTPADTSSVEGRQPRQISAGGRVVGTCVAHLLRVIGLLLLLALVILRLSAELPRVRRTPLRLGPESTVSGPSRSLLRPRWALP